ncbi:MAG: HAD family hydrolase [Bacillus sp. (in: firmicutes)]
MIKNILFDFDGVIIDSMSIKTEGFGKIFEEYGSDAVQALMDYHNLNGGLSRYVKIKYFFEEILSIPYEENDIARYADKFAEMMRVELNNPEHLISEVVQFIRDHQGTFHFHIVSGADEKELQYLCEQLNIAQYFKSIHGSPTHKNDLVKQLISDNHYEKNETILIGDSINDHEAAEVNGIDFYAYNNVALKPISANYIESMADFVL